MLTQKMNYKKYYHSVLTMPEPIVGDMLPKVKLRLRDMADYALNKGVSVAELTEEEKLMFLEKKSL